MNTYLGMDRGATNTDFVVLDSDSQIIHKEFKASRDWDRIAFIYKELKEKYNPDYKVFTGASDGIPEDIRESVFRADEIDSIAFGGAHASGLNKCLVVSMGTGTAIALYDNGRTSHIGGTGLGGGTLIGLGTLLAGTGDPFILERMARKGLSSKTNLTLSETGYAEVGFLANDLTVSNFGSIKSDRQEDIAAGIFCMIGEVAGVTASLAARQYKLEDSIVITGSLSVSSSIKNNLRAVGKLYGTTFIFPENPEYLTAIGAVKSFRHNKGKTVPV